MLQSQNQGQDNGYAILQPEEGGRLAGLLGEGDSRGKEVGIVIFADEAVPVFISMDSSNSCLQSYRVVKVFPSRLTFSPHDLLGAWSGPI